MKNDLFENEGDLKKCNTGSMFVPYVGCAVLDITSNMVHPEKSLLLVAMMLKCSTTSVGECAVFHMLE